MVPPRKKICPQPPPPSDVILIKFFNYSYLDTQYGMVVGETAMQKKRAVIYERKKFNPVQATIQEVVDYFSYLDLTEVMSKEYQEACISSLSKYLPHLREEMMAGAADGREEQVEGFKFLQSKFPPSFSFREAQKKQLVTLSKSFSKHYGLNGNWSRCSMHLKPIPLGMIVPTWTRFSQFCSRTNQDPFLAPPALVADFIRNDILFCNPEDRELGRDSAELLVASYNFYTKNIPMICRRLQKFLCGQLDTSLLQHQTIQELMRAAVAMEDKILSDDLALSLLPKHHYVRVRLNENEEKFWSSSFVTDVFYDARKSLISLPVAALELGVTTEMLFSGMMQRQKSSLESLPSLTEFLQQGAGTRTRTRIVSADTFWSDPRVVQMFEDVRNRRVPVAPYAFKLGVSRSHFLEVCGHIKTEEELEAEKALEEVKKINEREEAAKNYRNPPTQLEQQIWMAEQQEDDLCEYEQQRLANLRERMDLLEALDFEGEKREIRRHSMIISSSNPKEKEVVVLRKKSARIQRRQEQQRLRTSSYSSVQSKGCSLASPAWFGKTVPYPMIEAKVVAANPVPKFDLLATQLLEITTDYRASRVFLDSLSEEGEEQVVEAPLSDLSWAPTVAKTGESIVSASTVTGLDSRADLISFGTEDGGVGVLLEGRSVTLRSHNKPVTEVLMRGTNGSVGVMSSSLDGTVRLYDLARQTVALEYSWDQTSSAPLSVLSMVSTGQDTLLLDCGSEIINIDLRMRKASSQFQLKNFQVPEAEKTSLQVHPTEKDLISVCRGNRAEILDLRREGEALWRSGDQSWSHLEFAGWSRRSGQYYCCLTEGGRHVLTRPHVFDVINGLPSLRQRDLTLSATSRWNVLSGSPQCPWLPWQEELLFSVCNGELQLVDCRR